MWRSRDAGENHAVVCIACGTSLSRRNAREYDKLGNRWERHGKDFEYLCKPCYRAECHQPRDDLESLLLDIEDDSLDQQAFLARYVSAVRDRYGPPEEPES